ncbi:hypothetical protein K1W69_07490 [Hoeflea sp. WL0058]|uniref:Uncharacterized protein n=1 Tax=Flavimaribacter sediminis TaxID=2865987 RepID=A0AAE3D0H5_9HYPH|nr:hypothetical protein [Flavimaribacter sediminis]MBW8637027.1 hypothetical protein [Flavimaribacter sediminis]
MHLIEKGLLLFLFFSLVLLAACNKKPDAESVGGTEAATEETSSDGEAHIPPSNTTDSSSYSTDNSAYQRYHRRSRNVPPASGEDVGRAPASVGQPDPLEYRERLAALPKGSFSYNRTNSMWRHEPETVVLKLNASDVFPDIPASLGGEIVRERAAITPKMSAELNGTAGLEISPSGAVEKRISDTATTIWQWRVTPVEEGAQILWLTVYVNIDDQGPLILASYEDTIRIDVSAWQRTKTVVAEISPVWAFLAGLVSLISGLVVWFRKWRLKVGR